MICTDQLGRRIEFLKPPKRIVSLVPSQTELLVSLGLSDDIVGVTKFCVHPRAIRNQKVIVGGTKKVNFEKIKKLKPDIILCNKEENTKEIVTYLQEEYPVHVSDIFSIPEALEMIEQYGEIFNKKTEATTLISKIKLEKESFDGFVSKIPQKRVAYFIWKDPWMVTGKDTFVDHLLKVNGFVNVFGDKDRYPEITKEELRSVQNLDLIMLSSEPYPFSEKHINELTNISNAKVILVDGEYFSWYGSRLEEAFLYFKTLHEV
ncbi:ABC-type Fe3+-hydroxamate transport system substrate-binding protein [Aquimarina sp. MAR_2010_214]|uniref:ABC transporter substrate-binding protein n=1 Tax=Aquimarina sp. MAR_2010_214 TaxID=1250026 RepID=UPI000C7156B7|nr:helical backbone metal receptor [Aquimarina sp. MAR_2010_214]PKV52376.1 ABC-type Fe3+-hydroxamate transport system substrate-binding protein [Aquimarina sp. MAR_2010_214]